MATEPSRARRSRTPGNQWTDLFVCDRAGRAELWIDDMDRDVFALTDDAIGVHVLRDGVVPAALRIVLQPLPTARLRVVDAHGDPVPGARLRRLGSRSVGRANIDEATRAFHGFAFEQWFRFVRRARSDARGRLRLAFPWHSGMTCRVRIEAGELVSEAFVLRPSTATVVVK